MRKQIILDTDSYKRVHWKMLRKGLTKLYSYGEPRVGGLYPEISFFGIRMIIKDHFLQPVTNAMIDEAERRSILTFGSKNNFNRPVWEKVRDLGYLPIKIMAAPEGTRLREGTACFTLESTEEWFAGTVNALESLLMHTWYPTAIATRSMYIKDALKPYYEKTSMAPEANILFAVNDFGLRGATCHEAAARGGAGFLVHFMGSDNEPAQTALFDYYGCEDRLKSVWATEHSVALSYGLTDLGERDYLIQQLVRSDKDAIISVVIDTRDSDNFVQNIVGDEEIRTLIKEKPGRVVFRPDSGDPLTNVLKYLDMLGGIFGYSVNKKGFKVLNDNVGLIQGDGMNEYTIPNLYKEVTKAGWSADNFVTGSGGGLLQVDVSRDTSRWAIKPSYNEFGDEKLNVQKLPKTDMTKASKAGRMKLHPTGFGYTTITSAEQEPLMFAAYVDRFETVLENGRFYEESFTNILKRANQ
jgi:nicotinamide phosphoribosyltransferase